MTPEQTLKLLSYVPRGTMVALADALPEDLEKPAIVGEWAGLTLSDGEDILNVEGKKPGSKHGMRLADVTFFTVQL